MHYSNAKNSNLQLLCDVAVNEIESREQKTTEVNINSSTNFISLLKNIKFSKNEKYVLWIYEHEFTSWKEWIFILIVIFRKYIGVRGGLTVDNIFNLTHFFRTEWTKRGPYGGKTIKNTIYSVCSSAAKKNELYVTKRNRRSYYAIGEAFSSSNLLDFYATGGLTSLMK